MKVQLNELKNDQDEAIASKDFVRAQQLNLEMDQLKVGFVISSRIDTKVINRLMSPHNCNSLNNVTNLNPRPSRRGCRRS